MLQQGTFISYRGNMSTVDIMELSDYEKKLLKKAQIKLLDYIDLICRENNIQYTLAYGTLLGAVRHKGFIPWDDDVDIMMRRKDYEKFYEIMKKNTDDNYFFCEFREQGDYGFPFGKVMLKNTIMEEISISKNNAPKGIYVDVFPVDETYDDKTQRKIHYDKARSIEKKILCRCNYFFPSNSMKELLYFLKGKIYGLCSKEHYVNKYLKLIKSIKSNTVIELCSTLDIDRCSYPRNIFEEYIEIEFEKKYYKCVKEYDLLLTIVYGDYMKLPPLNQRVGHHYVKNFSCK